MYIIEFFLKEDKQLHIWVSLLLFVSIFVIRKYILKNEGFFRIIFFTIRDVFIIWLLKELIDLLWFWDPEFWDIIADSIGIIIPIYIYYLFKQSSKVEKTNLFKYERYLLYSIKNKINNIFFIIINLIKIKFYKLFYRKKIFLIIKEKQKQYEFKQAFTDLNKIFYYSIKLTFIWLINFIILFIQIPFLAINDTYKMLKNFSIYIYYEFQKIFI